MSLLKEVCTRILTQTETAHLVVMQTLDSVRVFKLVAYSRTRRMRKLTARSRRDAFVYSQPLNRTFSVRRNGILICTNKNLRCQDVKKSAN